MKVFQRIRTSLSMSETFLPQTICNIRYVVTNFCISTLHTVYVRVEILARIEIWRLGGFFNDAKLKPANNINCMLSYKAVP